MPYALLHVLGDVALQGCMYVGEEYAGVLPTSI